MTELLKKVKGKIRVMVHNFEGNVSLPYGKFILELVSGVLITGSCNITEISRSLNEKIKLKNTMKRLFNHLEGKTNLLELANDYLLSQASTKVDDSTIIALDDGDISHLFSNNFEQSCKVRDGSTGKYLEGYYLNQISLFDDKSNQTYPAYLGMYSTESKDFKSANAEGLKSVESFVTNVGKKGLWVMDRGYDNGAYLGYFLKECLSFIVRMKTNRHLIYKGKSVNIEELNKSINRRYKNGKHFRYGYLKCFIEIKSKLYPVTLISHKGEFNKESHIFLTNGHLSKSEEIKRRIRGYYRRWGVEESYRFEKQGFGIEKSIIRNFNSISSMLGAVMLAWSVLVDINEDEILREEVVLASKPEKKKRPQFIYYTLLRGVRNIFAGVKTLYLHRRRKKNKLKQLTIEDFLFPKSSLCHIV